MRGFCFSGDRIHRLGLQLFSGLVAIASDDLERNAIDSCCSYSNAEFTLNLVSIVKKTFSIGFLVGLLLGGELALPVAPSFAREPSRDRPTLAETLQVPVRQNTAPLELLDRGVEPRQALRLAPTENSTQTATISFDLDMTMTMAGQSLPAFNIPASIMTVQLTVNRVDPNGDIHYEFVYTDAEVGTDSNAPEQVVRQMRSQLQKMIGVRGTFVSDDRGRLKSGNFELPEGLDPAVRQTMEQMANSLEQLSSPLPEAAIGIGAQWQVRSNLDMRGMNMQQTTTYELADWQDEAVTLNVRVRQSAEPQTLALPDLPPNATVRLESLESQGQGQVMMLLDRLLPQQSEMSMSTDLDMNATSLQQSSPTSIQTQSSMNMTLMSE